MFILAVSFVYRNGVGLMRGWKGESLYKGVKNYASGSCNDLVLTVNQCFGSGMELDC